jgi:hypothetical protein
MHGTEETKQQMYPPHDRVLPLQPLSVHHLSGGQRRRQVTPGEAAPSINAFSPAAVAAATNAGTPRTIPATLDGLNNAAGAFDPSPMQPMQPSPQQQQLQTQRPREVDVAEPDAAADVDGEEERTHPAAAIPARRRRHATTKQRQQRASEDTGARAAAGAGAGLGLASSWLPPSETGWSKRDPLRPGAWLTQLQQQYQPQHSRRRLQKPQPLPSDMTQLSLAQLKSLTPEQLLRWQAEYRARAMSASSTPAAAMPVAAVAAASSPATAAGSNVNEPVQPEQEEQRPPHPARSLLSPASVRSGYSTTKNSSVTTAAGDAPHTGFLSAPTTPAAAATGTASAPSAGVAVAPASSSPSCGVAGLGRGDLPHLFSPSLGAAPSGSAGALRTSASGTADTVHDSSSSSSDKEAARLSGSPSMPLESPLQATVPPQRQQQ